MIEFVIKCDVCSAEIQKSNKKIESEKKIFQVIFITEQAEGMSCDPYLSDQKLDVCKSCESEMLKGKMIYGSGAMGYNKYFFRD